jgi:kynureninase
MELFEQAGMDKLSAKSKKLTGYLEYIVGEINRETNEMNRIDIITPKEERGCQLSLVISKNGKSIHDDLGNNGVISDWRHPDVIRVAPVPMYNSFEDVYRFGQLLLDAVKKLS